MNNLTYLTCAELSKRLKVSERTIREDWKDAVLVEGRHYIRPFGKRRLLFLWEPIEVDMHRTIGANLMGGLRQSA